MRVVCDAGYDLMNSLRAFFAVWLTLQVLLPLLPAWGVFLPHEHIARGRVSARDWQAHGENHRNPTAQDARSAQTKILSLSTNNGLASVMADSTAFTFSNSVRWMFAPKLFGRVAVHAYFAYIIAFPPPVPPPIL